MADEYGIFDKELRPGTKTAGKIKGGGSFKRAARASQRLPQAVVKVSSFSHGKGRTLAHIAYIGREGNLEVEDPQGNRLNGDEAKERVNEWASDFDTRKRSRDAANIVLSAPKGSDVKSVEAAARSFAAREFGHRNDYLFAVHDDTDHPHAHLSVKMRGYEGEKLNPGKDDLKQWREHFAECLRERGVEVDTTTRAERGQGKKGVKQAIFHMRQRGETPYVDRAAVAEVAADTKAGVKHKDKPWAVSAKRRTEAIKHEYGALADELKEQGSRHGDRRMVAMGQQIEKYSESIPAPKTWAEEFQETVWSREQGSQKVSKDDKDKDMDR